MAGWHDEPTERPPPPPAGAVAERGGRCGSPRVRAAARRSAARLGSPRSARQGGAGAASVIQPGLMSAAADASPLQGVAMGSSRERPPDGRGVIASTHAASMGTDVRQSGGEAKAQRTDSLNTSGESASFRSLQSLATRDRPIRPSNAGTFASGHSSYNLNFVDWENEWETYLESGPPGGYEVDYSSGDDTDDGRGVDNPDGPAKGVSWLDEHRSFWRQIDLIVQATDSPRRARQLLNDGEALIDTLSMFHSSEPSVTGRCDSDTNVEWPWARIRRLDEAVVRKGGFPPLRAVKLRQFPFNRLAASMEKRSTTCGICLEDIQDEDMCFELCHPFHVACIRPWFLRSQACPLCRRDFEEFCS